MLLLIDAGNTRVKWAMIPAGAGLEREKLGRWEAYGSVEHGQVCRLAEVWREARISRVLLANVAGPGMRQNLEQTLQRVLGLRPIPLEWFASVPQLGGIRNGYRNAAQLGCDRFASMIGARALFPQQALIVATCGTATTIDAISGEGQFTGGLILPGLGLMASALAKNTAQLPQVGQEGDVKQPFADNTEAAIAAGCIAAQAGAIERAVTAHRRACAAVKCVLSGGAALIIAPHLLVPHDYVDNLVLIGLQVAAAHPH